MAIEDADAPGIRGRFRVTPGTPKRPLKRGDRAAQQVVNMVITESETGVRKLGREVTRGQRNLSPQDPWESPQEQLIQPRDTAAKHPSPGGFPHTDLY